MIILKSMILLFKHLFFLLLPKVHKPVQKDDLSNEYIQ